MTHAADGTARTKNGVKKMEKMEKNGVEKNAEKNGVKKKMGSDTINSSG